MLAKYRPAGFAAGKKEEEDKRPFFIFCGRSINPSTRCSMASEGKIGKKAVVKKKIERNFTDQFVCQTSFGDPSGAAAGRERRHVGTACQSKCSLEVDLGASINDIRKIFGF